MRATIFYYKLLLLLAPLALTFSCMNRLFLYPSTERIRTNQQQYKIPFLGGELEIWRSSFGGGEPSAFVLEFVGNAARAEYGSFLPQNAFAEKSAEVWMVNYPGYGGSTGPAKLRSNVLAAEAAYQELTKVAKDKPIFFAGNSIGTTAALYLGARHSSAGLLLQNPPPLQRLVLGRFGWWNAWLIAGPVALWLPSELNSIKNARASKAPAIFFTAEDDNVVPARFQQMIVDAYTGPKTHILMPNQGHNEGLNQVAQRSLSQFIAACLL